MTKEVGCYNITFCGLSYDNNIPYDMVIIEKFNNNTYIEGSKKVLYFRHERGCIVPVFNTEKEKAIKGITEGFPETWNSETMEYIERNFTLIFE